MGFRMLELKTLLVKFAEMGPDRFRVFTNAGVIRFWVARKFDDPGLPYCKLIVE
jgi:hypothetical protein